jgi:hypothetical protein
MQCISCHAEMRAKIVEQYHSCEGCRYLEGGQVAWDRYWHRAAHLKGAWPTKVGIIMPNAPTGAPGLAHAGSQPLGWGTF